RHKGGERGLSRYCRSCSTTAPAQSFRRFALCRLITRAKETTTPKMDDMREVLTDPPLNVNGRPPTMAEQTLPEALPPHSAIERSRRAGEIYCDAGHPIDA